MIKKVINYFIEFHRGAVNIAAHIIGFAGIFYSIYKLDWILFGVFLIVLESGHIYNHLTGIKQYDVHPTVIFWRLIIFTAVVIIFFLVRRYLL